MFIYKITNKTNGEIYIGKTKNKDPIKRYKRHLTNAFKYEQQTYLYKAMRKYGKDNFKFEVIFSIIDPDYLNYMEVYFIDNMDPYYNMTKGGDGGRTADSPNFIQSMKIYHDKKCYNDYATNGFKGKKHKEESKVKQSESRKKYWEELDEEEYKRRCERVKGANNPMNGKTPTNAIRIRYDGIIYESLRAASDATGLNNYFLKKYGEVLND